MLKTQSKQDESISTRKFPSTNAMLKIGLGLVLVAVLFQAFAFAETISVDVEGTSYDVEYTGDGVTVSGAESDLDFISLILTVDVTGSPGVLDITFERSFFDSVYQGLDDEFIVLADGDEPTFLETSTSSTSRTLQIELPAGTEEVEIIGSVFNQPMEEPVVEETVEEPVVEETVEEPVVEETVEEPEPVVEETVEESDVIMEDTKPKTDCGEGTILRDGVCVLDDRCGPGTTFVDGVCTLDSTPVAEIAETDSSPKLKPGNTKELGYGLIAAFIVAGVIAIILGIMAKASRNKNN